MFFRGLFLILKGAYIKTHFLQKPGQSITIVINDIIHMVPNYLVAHQKNLEDAGEDVYA